jgi:hypothetical protein
MAQPTSYNTLNKEGVDVSVVYTMTASTTPETPAPPFAVGCICEGLLGSKWVFVQASTSITYNDWVTISGTMQANSMTSVNVVSSLGVMIGVAPGSTANNGGGNAAILAGTYFWAQVQGAQVQANAIAASTASNAQLFTSLTAGIVTSVASTSSVNLNGIVMTASATANPQTFMLTWPRLGLVSTTSAVLGVVGAEVPNP